MLKTSEMRIFNTIFILLALIFIACNKSEDLPATDAVMVKFVNKTGGDLEDLSVSRAEVGDLKKGKTSPAYHRYEQLGQQYGYALVEAVGTLNGKKHYTGAACQGVCGTASAPEGTWLEPGYYKIDVLVAKNEPQALEFKLQ
ncbi:MAG: hypothetical protein IT258_18325 [Saprospiraceae bacterium]|nr:hypothetical protein [Saprospiraceae bacterium]